MGPKALEPLLPVGGQIERVAGIASQEGLQLVPDKVSSST
jgi:hypothetical protein